MLSRIGSTLHFFGPMLSRIGPPDIAAAAARAAPAPAAAALRTAAWLRSGICAGCQLLRNGWQLLARGLYQLKQR